MNVVQVECPPLERGEIVRVMDDCEEMVKLQRGFGGWNEDMTEVRWETGRKNSVLELLLQTCLDLTKYLMHNDHISTATIDK